MGKRPHPPSALDRLPTDWEQPRKAPVKSNDLHPDASALQLVNNSDEQHWAAWQAITKLHGDEVIDLDFARELLFAFGLEHLGGLSRPASLTSPRAIACPTCGAAAGSGCRTERQDPTKKIHISRTRRYNALKDGTGVVA